MKNKLKKTARQDVQTVVSCADAKTVCKCAVGYCQCSSPSEYVVNDSWQHYDNSAKIYR